VFHEKLPILAYFVAPTHRKWEASGQGRPPNHVAVLAALVAGLERWKNQHAASVSADFG
jgi:hypothetical protein